MIRLGITVLIAVWLCGCAVLRADEGNVVRRRPVVALLDDGVTVIAPVVEAKLLAEGSADFVERNQIDQVLKEQKLQAAFSGDAVRQRSQLGKLLKCDLLILLRTTTGLPGEAIAADGAKPPEVIECVVCETKSGLRLHTGFVSKHRPAEVNAADLFDLVQQGLTRWRNRIVQVFAVPPLISDDLDFRRNYLQAAYARLMQQQLLEIPGTVVVELAEAQAIAREWNLAGEAGKLDRALVPFYILGRYRHTESTGQPTVKFSLRLEQDGRELRVGDSPALPPADAPEWIQRATAALVRTAGRAEPAKRDAQKEATQLAKRAAEFMQIGHWDEALALTEASLLLNPNQVELRQSAITCCGHVRNQSFAARVPLYELTPVIKKGVGAYRRGLKHLEIYLQSNPELTHRSGGGNFLFDFDGPFWDAKRIQPNAPDEAQTLLLEMQSVREETYFRLGLARAKLKHSETFWFHWLAWGRPVPERLALVRRLIERAEEAPPVIDFIALDLAHLVRDAVGKEQNVVDRIARAPEVAKLLEQLDRSGTPTARTIVAETRKKVDELFDPSKQLTFRREPALRADLNAEFQLQPVTLHSADRQPVADLPFQIVPAGPGCDLYAGRYTVYLMKRKNDLKPIWREPSKAPCIVGAAFDGKYVWCLLDERRTAPRLLLIDPEGETAVEVKSRTAFPAVQTAAINGPAVIAGLSPGRALVVAYMGRTWVGVVESNANGDGDLKIVYEARGAETADAGAGQAVDTAFNPAGLYPYRRKSGELEVLITRMSQRVTNLRFSSALTYSDTDQTVKPTDRKFDFSATRGMAASERQVQFLDFDRNDERLVMYLSALDDEELSPRVLVSDVPWGKMVWHEGRLHILGEKWWIWNPQRRTFRELEGAIPWQLRDAPYRFKFLKSNVVRKPDQYDLQVADAFSTQHYGLVLLTNHQPLLQAVLPDLSEKAP